MYSALGTAKAEKPFNVNLSNAIFICVTQCCTNVSVVQHKTATEPLTKHFSIKKEWQSMWSIDFIAVRTEVMNDFCSLTNFCIPSSVLLFLTYGVEHQPEKHFCTRWPLSFWTNGQLENIKPQAMLVTGEMAVKSTHCLFVRQFCMGLFLVVTVRLRGYQHRLQETNKHTVEVSAE